MEKGVSREKEAFGEKAFFSAPVASFPMGLRPFTLEMPFLVARGQGRGLKAGSAGGEDPMKDRFPSAEGGGKGRAICAPPGRFRPDR
jgi:hypothetical protein